LRREQVPERQQVVLLVARARVATAFWHPHRVCAVKDKTKKMNEKKKENRQSNNEREFAEYKKECSSICLPGEEMSKENILLLF